jgi:hypothetical protein
MASIKIKGTLESADLLGFPMNLNLTQSFTGVGSGKSFQKFTTATKAGSPVALNGKAFSSTDERVYIYLKNTSSTVAEKVNVYIKVTTVPTAAELNAIGCCTECAESALSVDRYIRIAIIEANEYVFIPLADQQYLYADAASGTPTVDFLILEE